MSRTDKDRPLFVKNTDETLPLVATHQHVRRPFRPAEHRRDPSEECNLLPVAEQRVTPECRSDWSWTNCEWRVAWWKEWRNVSPPNWFRKSRWYNPERVRVRDVLGEARKEYRGGSWREDVEEGGFDYYDFPNYQHHHRSAWDWD